MSAPHERFRQIYDAYSGLIVAYAARRTLDADVAGDIAAETFLVAWRRIEEVPAGEAARPWLYRVAGLVLANHRRGVDRRRRLDEKLAASLVPDSSSSFDQVDGPMMGRVLDVLSEMSADDRELLMMVAWDDLSTKEIAAILGCSVSAVRVRLHRARKRVEAGIGAPIVVSRSMSVAAARALPVSDGGGPR